MEFKIIPQHVFKCLLLIIISLFIFNCIGLFFLDSSSTVLQNLAELFNFDTEKSIPTLFSVLLLFFAAALLLLAFFVDGGKINKKWHWFFLSIVFIFLAIDESLQIHERINGYIKTYIFQTDGLLYYVWVIPYGVLALLLFIFYLKFLWRLPKKTRNLLIISGVIFCIGAVGIEILEGGEASSNGKLTLTYAILYSVEELLEMLGVTLLIFTLLNYIQQQMKSFKFTLNSN